VFSVFSAPLWQEVYSAQARNNGIFGYLKNRGIHAIVAAMKSPALILFIIFNLLAINLVSATSMYNDEVNDLHQLQAHDDAQNAASATCVDESTCDHFCHISAHMMGFISYPALLSTVDTSTVVVIQDEKFYSLSLDPPSQPPRA